VLYRYIRYIRGKKEATSILGITLKNQNTVPQFLARIISILQCIKALENLAEHFNIVTWRWRHIWRHIWRHQKCRLQRRTFFSKGKTWHCTSIAKRICEQKLESSLIKFLSEKLTKSLLFGSGCRPPCSCRHCSVQWRRAVAVSQHALRRRYIL